MKTIDELAAEFDVRARYDCGERVIAGQNGHLYYDGETLKICFSDDGRKVPFSSFDKPWALRRLGRAVLRITQEGDWEFIAELDPAAVDLALAVLKVPKRRKRALKTKDSRQEKTHAEAAPATYPGRPPAPGCGPVPARPFEKT
jgi:hypothetical protein